MQIRSAIGLCNDPAYQIIWVFAPKPKSSIRNCGSRRSLDDRPTHLSNLWHSLILIHDVFARRFREAFEFRIIIPESLLSEKDCHRQYEQHTDYSYDNTIVVIEHAALFFAGGIVTLPGLLPISRIRGSVRRAPRRYLVRPLTVFFQEIPCRCCRLKPAVGAQIYDSLQRHYNQVTEYVSDSGLRYQISSSEFYSPGFSLLHVK